MSRLPLLVTPEEADTLRRWIRCRILGAAGIAVERNGDVILVTDRRRNRQSAYPVVQAPLRQMVARIESATAGAYGDAATACGFTYALYDPGASDFLDDDAALARDLIPDTRRSARGRYLRSADVSPCLAYTAADGAWHLYHVACEYEDVELCNAGGA